MSLAILCTGFAVSAALAEHIAQEKAIRHQLVARARGLVEMQARLAGAHLAEARLEDLHRLVRDLHQTESVLYAFVVDEADMVRSDGGAGRRMFAPVDDHLAKRVRAAAAGILEFGDQALHAAAPVFLDRGAVGVMRIGLSLEPMHEEIRALRVRTVLLGVLFLCAGLTSGFMMTDRTTRPLAGQTRQAGRGRPGERPAARMSGELAPSAVSRDYASKILNTMSEALVVLTPAGEIRSVNAATCELLGYDEGQLVGRSYLALLDQSPAAPAEMIERIRRGERPAPIEAAYLTRDGERIPVLLSGAMMDDRSAIVCVAQDIRVRKLAYLDAVTELPNRVAFQSLLSKAVAHARRHGERLAVLFLDLDHFKLINDSYGHDAGDHLLRNVGARLSSCVRQSDGLAYGCAGPANAAARLGGDEFTLLLSGIASEAEAAHVAEHIFHALSQPFEISGRRVLVGISIGIAVFPDHGTDPETLVKHADTAMYHAKRQGRNNTQFFSDRLQEHAAERLMLESELRLAVATNALTLAYQPQMDARSEDVVGVEALLRWHHPKLGTISPAEFVPIAEETGLIVPLGQWMLREACRQGKEWLDSGAGPLRIAVNVSGVQLERDDFAVQVRAALAESGLPPSLLELEITEMAAVRHPEATAHKLDSLQALGVRIAIDDFGTGYSGLNYLKRFAVDRLKIDRSFIRNIQRSERDAAMVNAILAMARALEVTVLAEGVETEEQVNLLRAAQCQELQGFYASPALAPEDFITWLVGWRHRCIGPRLLAARA